MLDVNADTYQFPYVNIDPKLFIQLSKNLSIKLIKTHKYIIN